MSIAPVRLQRQVSRINELRLSPAQPTGRLRSDQIFLWRAVLFIAGVPISHVRFLC